MATSIKDELWEEGRRDYTREERRVDSFAHSLSTNCCTYTSYIPLRILLRYASDLDLVEFPDSDDEVSVKEASDSTLR